ncbi:protein kinase family protein [Kribbella albertanoniae]|uniref:protein kinase family protein n=1 Tax=Kribbella albertanoniae TaxID=1266829 RepID=UPI00192D7AF2|nr:protein kinase family protein [Kribbella albertanoniae]
MSTKLSLLSDQQLRSVVAAGHPLESGIGGRLAEVDVDGTRVFVKRIPLTDLELQPGNVRSTANLFELPLFYQYGVGSAGFGAWRELAVHTMTTNWVLANEFTGFPLMYHWRIQPDSAPEGFADGFGGIDPMVAHWEGSEAVRRRLEAIGGSSHNLVVFLEFVPSTLDGWLNKHPDPASYEWLDNALMSGADFMSAQGLVHFDAHFNNLLTDGQELYFADFGLALYRGFDLSAAESEFLSRHLCYDRVYAAAHLLRYHLPDGIRSESEHDTFLSDWIPGRKPDGVSPEMARIIDRHAATSITMDDFYRRLRTQSKRTPFPTAEFE